MKYVRWLAAAAVLAMLACATAQAEEASVLLEAGVYAEEVVGDIDKAIETYQKIIADAQASRRCVAEAHYRLGKCLLAKGEKEKALEQFALVSERYADQEALVRSARDELAKLEPPVPASGQLVFGPVIERFVNDDSDGVDFFIDFDKGKVYSPQDLGVGRAASEDAIFAAIRKLGIDAAGETAGPQGGLAGIDVVVVPCHSSEWDTIEPAFFEQEEMLSKGVPGFPVFMSAKGTLPATYLLKTREGGRGILQILELRDQAPRGVKIRYKLVQDVPAEVATPAFRSMIELPPDFGRGKNVLVDFESGKVYSLDELDNSAAPLRAFGVDAGCDTGGDKMELTGFDAAIRLCTPDTWHGLSAAELAAMALPAVGSGQSRFAFERDRLPVVYAFQTAEGGRGLLQFLQNNGGGAGRVMVRYKMVGAATSPSQAFLADLDSLGTALALYEIDTGSFPTTDQGLDALIARPAGVADWHGPYIRAVSSPNDPWGKPYRYAFPIPDGPGLCRLTSDGPDGIQGTGDDVSGIQGTGDDVIRTAAGSDDTAAGSMGTAAQLADLRIRLAEAEADLVKGRAEVHFAQMALKRAEAAHQSGVGEPGVAAEAELRCVRAEADYEGTIKKVEILRQEVARLEGAHGKE